VNDAAQLRRLSCDEICRSGNLVGESRHRVLEAHSEDVGASSLVPERRHSGKPDCGPNAAEPEWTSDRVAEDHGNGRSRPFDERGPEPRRGSIGILRK